MSNVPETTTISVDKKDVELIETTTSVENDNNNEETQSKKKKKKRRRRQSASLSTDNIVSDIKKNKINCCNKRFLFSLSYIIIPIYTRGLLYAPWERLRRLRRRLLLLKTPQKK